jgi:DNA-binding NarL/FixJ family response regulator
MADTGRILVVTSDDDLGRLIEKLVARIGLAGSEIATGEGAVASAKRAPPSLVFLDLDLSGASGYEVCFELRRVVGDDLPIIFLSGERTDPEDRVAGLLIGADDYVTKPFDPDELLVRARRLLSRARVAEPAAVTPLTGRELQVLRLLAGGLTQEGIAKELYISPKTVGTHIQRILTKLGVHSRSEAVAIAYRSGMMTRPPPIE